MFPPPGPWTSRGSIDPEREYVALTSRFFLGSWRHLPGFLAAGWPIRRQLATASGLVGWSMGSDLLKLEFHTLSAWEDAESLYRFVGEGGHGEAMRRLSAVMRRPSIFVQYRVRGRDLPLGWSDAIARQERQNQLQESAGR